MKTANLLRAIAAVSLLTLFSCSKENGTDINPDQPGDKTYTLSISATKGEINTKTLTTDVVDGKTAILSTWSTGDAVFVYKGATRLGTLTAQGSGASTTLSGTIDNTVAVNDVLTLKFQGPAYASQNGTLTGNSGSIDKVCDYSTATVTISGIEKNTVNLEESVAAFESQQAIVKFKLKKSDDPDTALDAVSNLVVNAGSTKITIIPPRATNVFYVAIPPLEDGTLSLEASAGTGAMFSFTGTGFTFAKGSYYELDAEMAIRYYYNVTAENTYTNLKELLDETGYDLSAAQSLIPSLFPDSDTPASAISYTYISADPQGNPVELSAVLYIPDSALKGLKLTGISLTNHGTIASNAECPTKKTQFEGAIAWKNYAVVMPDYYGFGATSDRPQAYLDAETTARGNIDAYIAAVQLLKDRNVTIPDKLYSFGYSQGGFNSMANLKYVSEHPELGIHFEKVLCGGSPFDVELTWNAYTQGTFRNAIGFVPLTLVSINESQRLSIDYGTLFKGALLENWREWILSKKYNLSTINEKLGSTTTLADILHEDIMAGRGDSYSRILDVCRRYSLTSGWTPPSGTKIILFHSSGDDTVPYDNLGAMKTFLDGVAPDCYSTLEGPYGGHVNAVLYYVLFTISEW